MTNPLKSLLINHGVFEKDEKRFDNFLTALENYVKVRINENHHITDWETLNPPIEIKKK